MGYENHFFLAQRLKSGDAKAFDFLMENFYQNLCTYSYSLIHDYAKAEDIVQNVFVDLWIKRENINPELSLKNYMYRSVHNGFIDQYRKNKPIIYVEKKYLEALDHVVEIEPEIMESLKVKLQQEIGKLPKKCKQIFLLNKKEGLTQIEISEYLGVSTKTVEGHITRAFKILNKKLGGDTGTILFLLF